MVFGKILCVHTGAQAGFIKLEWEERINFYIVLAARLNA